ncbi:MAG: hypothetical protein KME20_00160 [Kaiparowitsia implicata GSE-PSE-MK54-09C]|jgi:hypothetical protein|nr:hypothetical protein [Kaiparowitsia implicata GSE-PSE-MK54-09C]
MKSEGVSTGLKLWLIFFLLFFLMQYPVDLSIFLGLIAALAGGYISYCLTIGVAPPPAPVASVKKDGSRFNLRQRLEEAQRLTTVRSLLRLDGQRKGRSSRPRL